MEKQKNKKKTQTPRCPFSHLFAFFFSKEIQNKKKDVNIKYCDISRNYDQNTRRLKNPY